MYRITNTVAFKDPSFSNDPHDPANQRRISALERASHLIALYYSLPAGSRAGSTIERRDLAVLLKVCNLVGGAAARLLQRGAERSTSVRFEPFLGALWREDFSGTGLPPPPASGRGARPLFATARPGDFADASARFAELNAACVAYDSRAEGYISKETLKMLIAAHRLDYGGLTFALGRCSSHHGDGRGRLSYVMLIEMLQKTYHAEVASGFAPVHGPRPYKFKPRPRRAGSDTGSVSGDSFSSFWARGATTGGAGKPIRAVPRLKSCAEDSDACQHAPLSPAAVAEERDDY